MEANRSLLRKCAAAALALTISSLAASARFMAPQPTPVDRLLNQAQSFVQEHPEDAEGVYTLARIHYLAFHLKQDEVPAFPRSEAGKPPAIAPQWMVSMGNRRDKGADLPAETLLSHAAKAAAGFEQARQLGGKEGLAGLGLASLGEEFLTWKAGAKPAKLPPELEHITPATVWAEYAQAMEAALPKDSKLTNQPVSGTRSLTSHEAATALVRLAKGREAELSAADQVTLATAQKTLARFKDLPMGPITPLVLALKPVKQLDDLLAPEKIVDFDLRGYGPRDRWPWLQPELGLLVWDPEQKGEIRSARQLFGGYSFEIPRADGYAALAVLDANHDGVLSGPELDGLSVWFDRSGDGVSSRDEVTPVRDLGIESLAVTPDGHDGIHLKSSRGMTLRGGRTLPTWDWMVAPAPASRPLHEAP